MTVSSTGSEARLFLQAFCKDVQHGHAKIIRCLEENLEQPTFNATCKAEIQKHAANAATDYRCAFVSSLKVALPGNTGRHFDYAPKGAGLPVCCASFCCAFHVTFLRSDEASHSGLMHNRMNRVSIGALRQRCDRCSDGSPGRIPCMLASLTGRFWH